jgi:hypothetical protein
MYQYDPQIEYHTILSFHYKAIQGEPIPLAYMLFPISIEDKLYPRLLNPMK